ncbi:pyridoxal phosphate-dependent aminotransferase [Paenibacillus athensensis]|uniref:Aminotransferase n=1 Tax=Paenibacillus athensensis TaxID=1967502 RepID=A0A4Y8Q607_9BACL|nr:pyridoxal phosphate-dependent aminotransferase [Paenibacillus athensensis]MCD1259879.1 pyridoxal phosphate-dependent aminotransferase [Paenibacillus athensensis]
MGTISHNIASSLEKGSWIRKLFDEGARLKGMYGADAVFDFSLGNPIVEPPEAFARALQEVMQEEAKGKHQYIPNQGLVETRAKVADFINQRFQTRLTAATVVMTVGAGGALNVVLKSILEPGEEVVVLTPYFVEYDFYVANHGGVAVHCPLAEDFSLDFAELEQAITAQTKAVLVNTPHNPTGTMLSQEQLNQLGALLGEKEKQFGGTIYMVYDDPYSQLVYESNPPNPFEAYGRTILASSFSKDLGIAGERIGYIAVEPAVEDSQLLTSAFVFCNRTLGFVNAPVTMQRVIARMDSLVTPQLEYKQRRDLMVDVLRDAGLSFIVPQGGFFVFPKAPIADDVAFCLQAAQDFRLLLVPGSGFGRAGYFRLSYSVPLEQIERSRDVFKQVMAVYQ